MGELRLIFILIQYCPHFFKLHLKEGRLPYLESDIDIGFLQELRNVFFRFQQIHHAH